MSKGKTQKNFQGTSPSYTTPQRSQWPVTSGQVNFQGEGNTKKGGGNRSRAQTNFPGTESITVKTKDSHYGEKSGTGCNNGY